VHKLGALKLTDGMMLDSGVNQLVDAMAGFQTHNADFDPATATQMPNDPTLQTAIAGTWHHA
jgi:hypothetical protein